MVRTVDSQPAPFPPRNSRQNFLLEAAGGGRADSYGGNDRRRAQALAYPAPPPVHAVDDGQERAGHTSDSRDERDPDCTVTVRNVAGAVDVEPIVQTGKWGPS